MEPITDINQIKYKVLSLVAKHSYDRVLKEKLESIPYEIISGTKAQFRCCVYREREIIWQRVRLATGRLPREMEEVASLPEQIVHVIPCACEGCPITRFTVTSNCQNCLTKKCFKSCNFGAILQTPNGAVIDKEKCKKCGKCVTACPYKAIVDTERPCKRSCPVDAIDMNENDLAFIDTAKCINCGACALGCPFGAISDKSMMVPVIENILEGKNVYALLAPAIEGQFGDFKIDAIKAGVKKLGFKNVYEVALGADLVAYKEAEELFNYYKEGKVMTTSCCPAFINMVYKYYPSIADCVSTTVSPMVATARYVKSLDPTAVTVFVGPCMAKKNEAIERYKGVVDYVITFEELMAMFDARPNMMQEDDVIEEEATTYGKGFAKSGGVARAAVRAMQEQGFEADIKINIANGADECKKALLLLKVNKLQENFIEGMTCKGGCLNGPACVKDISEAGKVFAKYLDNGSESIKETVHKNNLENIDIHIKK